MRLELQKNFKEVCTVSGMFVVWPDRACRETALQVQKGYTENDDGMWLMYCTTNQVMIPE